MLQSGSLFYCPKCGQYHISSYCPYETEGMYQNPNPVYAAYPTIDNSGKIVELLEKILAKLEEIRMEIPNE